MSPQKRSYTPWETMMLSEWVARTFGDVEWRTHVHLGPHIPRNGEGRFSDEELRLLGVWRRWADAIVFLRDRLVLVEAVMAAHPGKLSTLALYEKLLPQTPELREYVALPVQKVMLYVLEDPVLNILAREQNILPIQFVPSFFDEWFAKLRHRDRRTPRSE